MTKVTIIGAGLAGSLMSIYLAKKGFNVEVYEKRPDMRIKTVDAGRSINLALSERGLYALKEVGLLEEIEKIALPMYGRYIHTLNGTELIQAYGKDNTEYINSVSRAELNRLLLDTAENNNVKIIFNKRCNGINIENSDILFRDTEKGKDITIKADAVIAADGAASAVRMEMLKMPGFNLNQTYENYGYKELTVPPAEDGSFRMNESYLHIWPRGSFMLIALPNPDRSFTSTLFIAQNEDIGGEASFEYLDEPEKLHPFFKSIFPDVYENLPTLENDFFINPTGSLITIKCFPWNYNKTLILGDAAHAIVPFFGQGMNAAFEDCTSLNRYIEKFGDNWNHIFTEFQNKRKGDTDSIADLAQENFIEMRDLVDDPEFQLRKKIEVLLAKKYPDKFIPKYSMVTFSRLPYSVALYRGKIQENILKILSEKIESTAELDWDLAGKLVNEKLDTIKNPSQ